MPEPVFLVVAALATAGAVWALTRARIGHSRRHLCPGDGGAAAAHRVPDGSPTSDGAPQPRGNPTVEATRDHRWRLLRLTSLRAGKGGVAAAKAGARDVARPLNSRRTSLSSLATSPSLPTLPAIFGHNPHCVPDGSPASHGTPQPRGNPVIAGSRDGRRRLWLSTALRPGKRGAAAGAETGARGVARPPSSTRTSLSSLVASPSLPILPAFLEPNTYCAPDGSPISHGTARPHGNLVVEGSQEGRWGQRQFTASRAGKGGVAAAGMGERGAARPPTSTRTSLSSLIASPSLPTLPTIFGPKASLVPTRVPVRRHRSLALIDTVGLRASRSARTGTGSAAQGQTQAHHHYTTSPDSLTPTDTNCDSAFEPLVSAAADSLYPMLALASPLGTIRLSTSTGSDGPGITISPPPPSNLSNLSGSPTSQAHHSQMKSGNRSPVLQPATSPSTTSMPISDIDFLYKDDSLYFNSDAWVYI